MHVLIHNYVPLWSLFGVPNIRTIRRNRVLEYVGRSGPAFKRQRQSLPETVACINSCDEALPGIGASTSGVGIERPMVNSSEEGACLFVLGLKNGRAENCRLPLLPCHASVYSAL